MRVTLMAIVSGDEQDLRSRKNGETLIIETESKLVYESTVSFPDGSNAETVNAHLAPARIAITEAISQATH